MIIDRLLEMAVNVVKWITQNVMTWQGPQPRNVWGDIEGMINNVASIGVWIDWLAIFAAVALAISVWLTCLGIKSFRALASHIPQFGGAG